MKSSPYAYECDFSVDTVMILTCKLEQTEKGKHIYVFELLAIQLLMDTYAWA